MSVIKKFQVFVKEDQLSESMLSYLGFTQFTVILTWERNIKNTWPSRQTPALGLKAQSRYVIYLFKAAIGQETTIKHTF